MNDLLTSKGWKMYHQCNCGGSPRQHWNHPKYPSYEIRTRPRRGTFQVFNRNLVIVGPEWGYKLETTLNAHGIGNP